MSKGEINEIIDNHTVYHQGEYRYYPTLLDLHLLLDEIIASGSTTDYIRITPFYVNAKKKMQVQFEEFMFYIECRDKVDVEMRKAHIKECMQVEDVPRLLNDERVAAILYPLCERKDTFCYKEALREYKELLWEIIPYMMETAKSEMELTSADLPFGHFCFEVHSG